MLPRTVKASFRGRHEGYLTEMSIKSIFEFVFSSKTLSNCSVLFIVKKRDETWGDTNHNSYHSSGLLNSAKFICDMLNDAGVRSKLVQVVDGNDIDREVFQFNPSVTVLEAIWCPPSKLRELTSLYHHKGRQWVVRNHSELPFLATEGISMEWLIEYAKIPGVHVSCNSPVANIEIGFIVESHTNIHRGAVTLLPNYYPVAHEHVHRTVKPHDIIDIGCFGAIRPLKNHAEQAVGALIIAKLRGKHLRFHINSGRTEINGSPILKTLRSLFNRLPHAELIEHSWLNHKEFLELCKTLDLGMQVSFSETFNICCADLVSQGVPSIASEEVPWMPQKYCADPTSSEDIAEKAETALTDGPKRQQEALKSYVEQAKKIWFHQLYRLTHD